MGLSRLENFLKNARGNILYVSPNDLDSTDSIENKGNSLTRPFKTIQRALIEAARFSYQRGLNNDRFNQTTILVYPGEHIIDNRPGWIPDGTNNFRLRNGTTSSDFSAWDLTTTYDLESDNNALYKMNSVYGGVILPRGTSLVGLDLRKTKIRPKYVPNPVNDNIQSSAIFRVTGGCYFWQFSLFDADPNANCYVDYTNTIFVPNFSHHKLTCFEYADGVNGVNIQDTFQSYSTTRTDLDMYYEKVGLVYGQASGREIQPDYPSTGLDIQPKIDEFRIVGSTGQTVGITSIKAGNGIVASPIITVTTDAPVPGIDVDTPIRVDGITATGYNGQYVVSEKLSATQLQYEVQNTPVNPLPAATGATLALQSDTVTSASPYIFNCSLRSVWGMSGLLADGAKADGFKSMVVAQFTGIGLQKDDNAFVLYNSTTGVYDDSTIPGNETLSTNSRSIHKAVYRNFHIKCINNSFIQCVSVFAIGYAEHFVVENGGDMSITNSNSNFGAKSLVAVGFRDNAFRQDDLGYVTHIIPPKELGIVETSTEFLAIDVAKTVGVGSTGYLYLYNQTNPDAKPENVLEGYRIGARENDRLKVLISFGGTVTEYSSRIVMPNSQISSEKIVFVDRSITGINSISNNVLTLKEPHSFLNGESIRILSDNGQLPDGLSPNIVYYALTDANASSGLTTSKNLKISKTFSDAQNAVALTINNIGGSLKVVSRVSDKNSGDLGHPIQYDTTQNQWHIRVSSSSTDNSIYPTLVSLGTTTLGNATPRTFISRLPDNRNSSDTIYRLRYVIPAANGNKVARPPIEGYLLQESNTSIGSTASEILPYFGTGSLSDVNQQRNFRFISHANFVSSTANFITDLPHDLSIGSQVEIVNVKSANNPTGAAGTGYNRAFIVTGISSAKGFSVGLNTNPGSFDGYNDLSTRTTSLPYYKRKKYVTNFYVFRSEEVQRYISGKQDGVYYLTVLNSSNSPAVSPFTNEKYSQPVKELYPQVNRDNPSSDPQSTKSFAQSNLIGEVIVDDVRSSLTKETVDKYLIDIDNGVRVNDIITIGAGSTNHTIRTAIDHGLNRVTQVSIASSGAGYGSGSSAEYYNARLVGAAGSTTGQYATAKVSVDATGGITAIRIMDGGSAYGIGNTLSVVGIATTTGHIPAVVTVTKIYNNVGDTVRITGVTSTSYQQYNNLYRITEIPVGAATTIIVSSASTISGVSTFASGSTSGIGVTVTANAFVYLTGQVLNINTLSYDKVSGIATVTTSNKHGLRVDSKVRISGADQPLYNGSFIVKQNISLTSFSINVGIGTTAPTATGTLYGYREGVTSNGGTITIDNENLNGRMVIPYAGITTTLSATISDSIVDQINISDVGNLDLNIGDYLQIDDEIVRIKTTLSNPATNPVYVFRGVLGTKAVSHVVDSVVRRVKPQPTELRRHSINRASGHTFEYVGYGPGNYSTAFPDKQDRQVSSQEELLSQTTRREGGVNFFTGMNDKGISYSGNKKLSTVTGQEEIFDTPIRTILGEDIGSLTSINVIGALEGSFTRSIRVEGGSDNKSVSEFNGPVIFNGKVTSNSINGLEANSLYLQGDSAVSRKYTVGVTTPTLSGNPGDVIFFDSPVKGGYLGWVYTSANTWNRFGVISNDPNIFEAIFDKVGIGTTTAGSSTLRIGAGTSLVAIDSSGVGIGTTANGKKLNIIGDYSQTGNANISGVLTAGYFSGDGGGLVNLNASATGWSPVNSSYAGVGNTGIWNAALTRVGIGTSVPKYNLELGIPGAGTTDLYANNNIIVNGQTRLNNLNVTGVLTSTNYRLDSTSSNIRVGILTATTLVVGTALSTSGTQVGLGTASPRAKLDIEGSVKFKTYSEYVQTLTISSGNVNVDLSVAQSFTLDVTSTISQFTVLNPPTGSTSFTIKITQGSTAYSVDIDTFKNGGGSPIPVYWPGGGVLPIVTQIANRTDIYSFKTFDGGSTLFGVVGGQNFA